MNAAYDRKLGQDVLAADLDRSAKGRRFSCSVCGKEVIYVEGELRKYFRHQHSSYANECEYYAPGHGSSGGSGTGYSNRAAASARTRCFISARITSKARIVFFMEVYFSEEDIDKYYDSKVFFKSTLSQRESSLWFGMKDFSDTRKCSFEIEEMVRECSVQYEDKTLPLSFIDDRLVFFRLTESTLSDFGQSEIYAKKELSCRLAIGDQYMCITKEKIDFPGVIKVIDHDNYYRAHFIEINSQMESLLGKYGYEIMPQAPSIIALWPPMRRQDWFFSCREGELYFAAHHTDPQREIEADEEGGVYRTNLATCFSYSSLVVEVESGNYPFQEWTKKEEKRNTYSVSEYLTAVIAQGFYVFVEKGKQITLSPGDEVREYRGNYLSKIVRAIAKNGAGGGSEIDAEQLLDILRSDKSEVRYDKADLMLLTASEEVKHYLHRCKIKGTINRHIKKILEGGTNL